MIYRIITILTLSPIATSFAAPFDSQDDHSIALRGFAETWCIDCHQQPRPKADFDLVRVLDQVDEGQVPDALSRILQRLDARDMPPADDIQPDESSYDDAIFAIESIQAPTLTPLRPTVRRLSRYEYANTIRDLLGVVIEAEEELPVDEISDGFDNSGDVLSVSPLLLEKYLDLAENIATRAIAYPDDSAATTRHFETEELRARGRGSRKGSLWILSSRGSIVADVTVDVPGEYIIRAKVRGQQAGPEPVRMALRLDEEYVSRFVVEEPYGTAHVEEARVELQVGTYAVGASFLNDYFNPESEDPLQRDRNAFVEWIEIEGPVRPAFPTPIQRHLLDQAAALDCEGSLSCMVEELASRAWRRPVEARDVEALLSLSTADDLMWVRMRRAVVAMLVHPRFLFRIERQATDPSVDRVLDDWEIATRLSYFLWATMPDEELRRAARAGELSAPEGRARQVRRMLKNPRARTLSQHFATQWLQIRALSEKTPDSKLFPEVDEEMLRLMREETVRFFNEILREGLPVDRLIDANWTWLNESLAEHYGIEGVEGRRMRKVALEEDSGGMGILRHGSILLATSNPTRTSPVKRGKWVLEALLDDAPPPAPPGVAGLPDDGQVSGELSLREMLVLHRADPQCASCHIRMDALGFALEGFDAVGRPRTMDGEVPIDATGELPDGTLVVGGGGLRDQLLQGHTQRRFWRSLVKHLTTYALGRGLDRRDEPMLQEIVRAMEQDPTMHRLILEIVESPAFLYRPGDSPVMMERRSAP